MDRKYLGHILSQLRSPPFRLLQHTEPVSPPIHDVLRPTIEHRGVVQDKTLQDPYGAC